MSCSCELRCCLFIETVNTGRNQNGSVTAVRQRALSVPSVNWIKIPFHHQLKLLIGCQGTVWSQCPCDQWFLCKCACSPWQSGARSINSYPFQTLHVQLWEISNGVVAAPRSKTDDICNCFFLGNHPLLNSQLLQCFTATLSLKWRFSRKNFTFSKFQGISNLISCGGVCIRISHVVFFCILTRTYIGRVLVTVVTEPLKWQYCFCMFCSAKTELLLKEPFTIIPLIAITYWFNQADFWGSGFPSLLIIINFMNNKEVWQ